MTKKDDNQADGCLHCKIIEVIQAHCRSGKHLRLDVHEIMDRLGAVAADILRYVPPEFHVDALGTFHAALACNAEYHRERAAEAAKGPITTGSVN